MICSTSIRYSKSTFISWICEMIYAKGKWLKLCLQCIQFMKLHLNCIVQSYWRIPSDYLNAKLLLERNHGIDVVEEEEEEETMVNALRKRWRWQYQRRRPPLNTLRSFKHNMFIIHHFHGSITGVSENWYSKSHTHSSHMKSIIWWQ